MGAMPETVLAAFRRSMAGVNLPAGSRLAVALSGGPDSMALATLVARALPQVCAGGDGPGCMRHAQGGVP